MSRSRPPQLHLPFADSEIVPPDCLRLRSFTTVRSSSLRREADDSRLSVSLCDLNLQQEDGRPAHAHSHRHTLHLASATASSSSSCPIPQNSLNSQQSSLLPSALKSDLRFHQLRGAHIKTLDEQTVARSEHAREERTLVFTSRPLNTGETVFIKVTKSSPSRSGSLSYGVTSCDPAVLRPSDLPYNPEALVDRKEFWAVCRVPTPLQSSDILGFLVNQEGEVILSHNGTNVGMQVCVDNSRPLWMFFGLHGAVTQLKILGKHQVTSDKREKSRDAPIPIPVSSICTDTRVEYSIHTQKIWDDTMTAMLVLYECILFLVILCVYCRETCDSHPMFFKNMLRNVVQITPVGKKFKVILYYAMALLITQF